MSTNQPRLLRFRNARAALRAVLAEGGVSRSELRDQLGISSPTIREITEGFVDRGVLVEVGSPVSSGGRPAARLGVVPDAARIVSLDLGGTFVRAGTFRLDGQLRDMVKMPTARGSREAVLSQVVSLIQSRLVDDGRVQCASIGVPGFVQDGIVGEAPNLPGWSNVPLKEHIQRELGINAIIENDVDFAALGETFHGVAQGCADAVFVAIGTGLGAGIVLNRQLIRGAAGTAGELAFLVPSPDMLDHSFGTIGALESLASASALPRHVQAGPLRDGTTEEVLAAARHGDTQALTAVETWSRYLSIGLIALCAICNPQILVLGGGGSDAYDLIEHQVNRYLQSHVPVPPRLARTQLGDEAALWGGYVHGLDYVIDQLASP